MLHVIAFLLEGFYKQGYIVLLRLNVTDRAVWGGSIWKLDAFKWDANVSSLLLYVKQQDIEWIIFFFSLIPDI